MELCESISSRVFHFCPLRAMYSIAKDDCMKLSSSHRESDARMSGGYPYFLSLSRTPSSAVGYQRMRINGTGKEWAYALVRIEFDGDRLNNNFKGSAQNYFTDKNDSKIKREPELWSINAGERKLVKKTPVRYAQQMDTDDRGKYIIGRGHPTAARQKYGYTDYSIIDRNQMHEYEDRLVSDKPVIEGVGKYIVRIDILIKSKIENNSNWRLYLAEIGCIMRRYGDKVHLYIDEVSFNSVNVRGAVNPVGGRYGELDRALFIRNYHNSLMADVDTSLGPKQKAILAKSAYCGAYVLSYARGVPVMKCYAEVLGKLGCGELVRDREAEAAVSNLIGTKFNNLPSIMGFTNSMPKEVEEKLSGIYREYADRIRAVFSEILQEVLGPMGLNGNTKGGAFRVFALCATVFRRLRKRMKAVAEAVTERLILSDYSS